eukprot:2535649-Pleurochrysis_carterae.AAC.3
MTENESPKVGLRGKGARYRGEKCACARARVSRKGQQGSIRSQTRNAYVSQSTADNGHRSLNLQTAHHIHSAHRSNTLLPTRSAATGCIAATANVYHSYEHRCGMHELRSKIDMKNNPLSRISAVAFECPSHILLMSSSDDDAAE